MEEVEGNEIVTSRVAYGTRTPSGNSRIFNCQICNRAFTREEHLTRHTLSTHNRLKPFNCGICGRPFSRRDLLLRHAKNLHEGSERAVSRIRKVIKKSKSDELDKHQQMGQNIKISDDSPRTISEEHNIHQPALVKGSSIASADPDDQEFSKRKSNKLKMSVSTLVS